MPKRYKLLIFFSVVLLLLISLYFVFRDLGQEQPVKDKINIVTERGTVEVKNFAGEIERQIEDTVVVKSTTNYSIIYFPKEKVFFIDILSQPVTEVQKQAEVELLNILQINQEQACVLKVVIRVAYTVDEKLTGKDLPLSFCEK